VIYTGSTTIIKVQKRLVTAVACNESQKQESETYGCRHTVWTTQVTWPTKIFL